MALLSHVQRKRLIGLFVTMALSMFCGTSGFAAPNCNSSAYLPAGDGSDVIVDGPCKVSLSGNSTGVFKYGNVNIIPNGQLIFEETSNVATKQIHFWAKSILVENYGSLIAGAPDAPFGLGGTTLLIHLWGSEGSTDAEKFGGLGAICKTPATFEVPDPENPKNKITVQSVAGHCGIPTSLWKDSSTLPVGKINIGTRLQDDFYPYDPLPFDDAIDPVTNTPGYFGRKVLGVSYGGSLKLFGTNGNLTLLSTLSGRSWGRLKGNIIKDDTSRKLTVEFDSATGPTWRAGDRIVVTTTDYLANHSEELEICDPPKPDSTGRLLEITFSSNIEAPNPCLDPKPINWTHNGQKFDVSRDPNRAKSPPAETRAAVGLLTRSIRIVSGGDTLGADFPAVGPDPKTPSYYYGGHTIVRQGAKDFQVQGVMFRQLGQGGKLAHYPIHFHMARLVDANNFFVKDSSINESMTRWVTVHGTQGVNLSRNVGYLSIGHGFYLEDATEINNQFFSNLGVFARAAIANYDPGTKVTTRNETNKRMVPPILGSPDSPVPVPNVAAETLKFISDKAFPAVFWITNGWNDFVGNMAAGAGMCGACFWEVPAYVGGPSQSQNWLSYAQEQTGAILAGTTPLRTFNSNYCTSAMFAFNDVGYTYECPGLAQTDANGVPITQQAYQQQTIAVKNPYAPPSSTTDCGTGHHWPICPSKYYPNVTSGQSKQATACPADVNGVQQECKLNPTTWPECTFNDRRNCLPTIINGFTASFNYAKADFAAIWLRQRWHLVSNSFISDMQAAGLTFLSGGDYTHSSVIPGLWNVAYHDVFVGETHKPADSKIAVDPVWAYASSLGPFNSKALQKCDSQPLGIGDTCTSKKDAFALYLMNFGAGQHVFNIYDGPASQDDNTYLDIRAIPLKDELPYWSYRQPLGIPLGFNNRGSSDPIENNQPYVANAAIGWKTPNGFYYPPTFRSRDLFFDGVDIRHDVIVPNFKNNTYITDEAEVKTRWRQWAPNMFDNFTAVDRQTELTDEDGTLTGFANSISVNEDKFFTAPIEGTQCKSDDHVKEGGTARTSPYGYVTFVAYPEAATEGAPTPSGAGYSCQKGTTADPKWASDCTFPKCYGIPLYRMYQTKAEVGTTPEFIRMAAMNLCQRESLTVNHGHYYVDLTVSETTQKKADWFLPTSTTPALNVFEYGKTYDFFHVFAKPETVQTYQFYVGPGFDISKNLKRIRMDISAGVFQVLSRTDYNSSVAEFLPPPNSNEPTTNYNAATGILTVTLNNAPLADKFELARESLCAPKLTCEYSLDPKTNTKTCHGRKGSPLGDTRVADLNFACSYAIKDIDCPDGGCLGFSVTLPAGSGDFAKDQTKTLLSQGTLKPTCFPDKAKSPYWEIQADNVAPMSDACYTAQLKKNFCQSP
jgi:hypothetical protein